MTQQHYIQPALRGQVTADTLNSPQHCPHQNGFRQLGNEPSASLKLPNRGDEPSVSGHGKNSESRFKRPNQLRALILPSVVRTTRRCNQLPLSVCKRHTLHEICSSTKYFQLCLAHGKWSINSGSYFFIIILPRTRLSYFGFHSALPQVTQSLTGVVVCSECDPTKEEQRSGRGRAKPCLAFAKGS